MEGMVLNWTRRRRLRFHSEIPDVSLRVQTALAAREFSSHGGYWQTTDGVVPAYRGEIVRRHIDGGYVHELIMLTRPWIVEEQLRDHGRYTENIVTFHSVSEKVYQSLLEDIAADVNAIPG